jgi:hypothetical protein
VIDELRIEGATRVGAAVPVKVGALDTFRVIDKLGEIEARTWAVALEGGDALVRVYVTPGAPREWVALRDRFIASLRVAE